MDSIMNRIATLTWATFLATLPLIPQPVIAQPSPTSLGMAWSEGAEHCEAVPLKEPLQVRQYDAQTFILRENLCATFEAPFIYLLLGSKRALLIDTGDVEDPRKIPLAETVLGLLPRMGASRLPLLVVHTHRHVDHRAADKQFEGQPNVEVVPAFLDDVRKHFGFPNWPAGLAQVELGDRTIEVIPTPGHDPTHVSFYDGNTGIFFSGDFLLPGRLLVADSNQYLASAERVADFVRSRTVTHVFGAHIEMNEQEMLFPWEATYHPQERDLSLSKEDLLSLPATLRSFNGLYTTHGKWVLINSVHELMAIGAGAISLLVALIWFVPRYLRTRKARRGANLVTNNASLT